MSRQMRRLLPKIYCVSAPSLSKVVTVWLRSSLICLASWAFIGVRLPTPVIAIATRRMTIVDRIRLRRGGALVHITMLNWSPFFLPQPTLWRMLNEVAVNSDINVIQCNLQMRFQNMIPWSLPVPLWSVLISCASLEDTFPSSWLG